MSNQVILWLMLLLPWVTIIFIKKHEIKRFMPAALFTLVTGLLIADVGLAVGLWVVKENIAVLKFIMPFALSLLPVATLWFFKFFYGRFWLYAIVQLVFSALFAYWLMPWLNTRGILVWEKATSLQIFIITIPHFIAIYFYHKWQEGIFHRPEQSKKVIN